MADISLATDKIQYIEREKKNDFKALISWATSFSAVTGHEFSDYAVTRVVSGTHKFDRGLSLIFYTPNYIGSMYGSGSRSSSASWCSIVCATKHPSTLSTSASLSPVPPPDNIFTLSAEIFSSCLAIVSAIMVGRLFLWPALRYGTGYQTVWEIRPSAETPSSVHWRRFFSAYSCT